MGDNRNVDNRLHFENRINVRLVSFAQGIYDVVSSDDLKGLTADDLQLLLSGKAEPVSCEQLRSISTFEDARGNALRSAEPEQLERFESLFWETVESMDESERLKLVGMATGSLVRMRVVRDSKATTCDLATATGCNSLTLLGRCWC